MGTSAVFVEPGPHGHRLTVLVDEAECVDTLRSAFAEAGFEVESIETGLDTIWDVAATCPDLVLVDARPPATIRDARRRIRELRAHPRLRGVPVILCATRDLRRIRIRPDQRRNVTILEPPVAGATLRELSGHLA